MMNMKESRWTANRNQGSADWQSAVSRIVNPQAFEIEPDGRLSVGDTAD
jgi:hypothetical protein